MVAVDAYLESLNRHIADVRGTLRRIEQAVDAHESFVSELKITVEEQESTLAALLKERAVYLCPFRVGDYVKGWDISDRERAAKVIGIYNTAKAPHWNVMIEKDGMPYTLYFSDPDKLRLANIQNEVVSDE